MTSHHQLGMVLLLTSFVTGCIDTGTGATNVALQSAPNSSAGTWQMPWQILPISAAVEAQSQVTELAWVPQTGWVRGTPAALASIGRPLEFASGRNRTVDACRSIVQAEAGKLRAKEVEVFSAGEDKLTKKGEYIAPVRVRITYPNWFGYDVREATMTCIVDRRLQIVNAYASL